MLSALMAIYSAGLKVSRYIHQESLRNYHIFRGGDHDLILIPVDSSHALLLAGREVAKSDRILQTVQGLLALREEVERILQSLGVAAAPGLMESAIPEPEPLSPDLEEPEPEVDLDALFASTDSTSKVEDVDAFWDQAVEKTSNVPTNPDVITFEEARKLGLTPGKTMPVKLTGNLKPNDPLKPPK